MANATMDFCLPLAFPWSVKYRISFGTLKAVMVGCWRIWQHGEGS
jgi:hypothetical protein